MAVPRISVVVPFYNSVDQLGEIDGIGPSRLDKLRALVRV